VRAVADAGNPRAIFLDAEPLLRRFMLATPAGDAIAQIPENSYHPISPCVLGGLMCPLNADKILKNSYS